MQRRIEDIPLRRGVGDGGEGEVGWLVHFLA